MFDFNNGVSIVKGCNLKITPHMTLDDFYKDAEKLIKKKSDSGTGYQHISIICNENLNYENENLVVIGFAPDGKIIDLDVHPNNFTIQEVWDKKQEVATICRQWLKSNGQFTDHQAYDWGRVNYTENDRFYFIGIRIVFNHFYDFAPKGASKSCSD